MCSKVFLALLLEVVSLQGCMAVMHNLISPLLFPLPTRQLVKIFSYVVFFFNSPLALCMCLSLFLLKAFCSAGTAANCSVLEAIEPYKLVSGGEKEMQHRYQLKRPEHRVPKFSIGPLPFCMGLELNRGCCTLSDPRAPRRVIRSPRDSSVTCLSHAVL